MSISTSVHLCPYCVEQDFAAPSKSLLIGHIRVVHSADPDFTIQCSEEGCSRTFTNFRTYQNHNLWHHSTEDNDDETVLQSSMPGVDVDVSDDENCEHVPIPSEEDIKSFTAKWILKTSETRKLTRTATLGIVSDVSEMIDFVSTLLKEEARTILRANEVESSVVAQISDIFSSSITKPFAGLDSFHQQLEYYKKNYNLIVSCHVETYRKCNVPSYYKINPYSKRGSWGSFETPLMGVVK